VHLHSHDVNESSRGRAMSARYISKRTGCSGGKGWRPKVYARDTVGRSMDDSEDGRDGRQSAFNNLGGGERGCSA